MQAARPLPDIAYLMTITQCDELPRLRVKKGEWEDLGAQLQDTPIKNVPDVWDVDYENYLASFKTSLFLQAWMDEATEDQILERFGMPPGEVYNRLKTAEWLCYAGREIARLLQKKDVANNWNKIVLRTKHGVREELLQLVALKGIGRARARLLYKNKIKNVTDVKKVPDKILSEILGPRVAKNVKSDIEMPAQRKMRSGLARI